MARDRGSLPLAMLLTLVGVSLSALLTPIVLTQLQSTRHASDRLRTGHAAQAGLDVALGHLRQATGLTSLPCGPWEGRVGAPDPARFRVTIEYLDSAEHQVPCATSGGVSSAATHARLTSHGSDPSGGSAGRTLTATYTLRTSAVGIGGLADLRERQPT